MMYISGTVTLSLSDSDVIFILLWTLITGGWNISWSPCKNYMLFLSMEGTWLWLIPVNDLLTWKPLCNMELKDVSFKSSVNANKRK